MLDDDYITVPKRPKEQKAKGFRCGECGMCFDHGKAYGFSCMNADCPMQTQIRM